MNAGVIPFPSGGISAEWCQSHIEWIYGFRLDTWQLEDLVRLLSGGIYTVMYPTDFGKSMLIELYVILSLLRNPKRRKIVVKINQGAADECCSELAKRLHFAATHVCPKCDVAHSEVKPLVAWRGGEPYGVGEGFWVEGAHADGTGDRNTNKSVRCYGIGSRDLQGKRGDTCIDDLERREEAVSVAERARLVSRVGAVTRTLEDYPDMLWAMFGTPQHEESIYFDLAVRLQDLGVQYAEIHRPLDFVLGTPFGTRRRQKIEIHRRTMPKSEFAAAYELRPIHSRKLTNEEIERLVKAREAPRFLHERHFYDWLRQRMLSDRPEYRDPQTWEREVLTRLTKLEFYIGWDPAGTGDWASAVIALLGRHVWVLRTYLGTGDAWDQASRIKGYHMEFPSAVVIIEKNGQQKAFKDVFEMACPEATIFGHATFSNKDSEQVGIPALIKDVREGYLHLPFGDEDWADEEFRDFIIELQRYGPTAHPHIIPAIWFCWYWSRKHEYSDVARAEVEKRQHDAEVGEIRIQHPEFATRIAPPRNPELRRRAQAAWGRRHR